MQASDGNFVLYSHGGVEFESNTHPNPGAYLKVQDDGNLVVYSRGGSALFARCFNGNAGLPSQPPNRNVGSC